MNDRGDSSPEGQLSDGILDQLAKFERAKTAERSRRGKKQKARGGKILSSKAAYGFAYNDSRDGYVIDPEQMAVMRRIFYMAGVERRSLCAIRDQLSQDGVPSPTGKPVWDVQGLRKLILRDLYKPHTNEELREAGVPEDVLATCDPKLASASTTSARGKSGARGYPRTAQRTGVGIATPPPRGRQRSVSPSP